MHHRAKLFVIGVLSASAASPLLGQVIGGPVVNPANGHSYYLLAQDNWTSSEAEAVGLGGHLATINDAAENQFVYATFSQFGGVNRNLWIGLNNYNAQGAYVWSSGEASSFRNWAPGEPNRRFGEEFFVNIWSPAVTNAPAATWNDMPNDNAGLGGGNFGVVEIVPEPTALPLFTLAATALLGRARRHQRR